MLLNTLRYDAQDSSTAETRPTPQGSGAKTGEAWAELTVLLAPPQPGPLTFSLEEGHEGCGTPCAPLDVMAG